MTHANGDTRAVRLLGIGFALLFTVASAGLLGELVGAFADSPSSFTYFNTSLGRLRHALGASLLTLSGILFMAFAVAMTRSIETSIGNSADAGVARLAAAVFTALVGVAAAAFATVSLSVGFGQITGDPGIQQGRELLPQLGYVVLFVPAALSAGTAILLLARCAQRTSQLPRWMIACGYLTASAQLFSFYTLPLLLLPLWVVGAGMSFRPPHG